MRFLNYPITKQYNNGESVAMEATPYNIIKNSNHLKSILEHSPVHVQLTWFHKLIANIGDANSALVLTQVVMYHENKYKSFDINNQKSYGLLYSAKEFSAKLNISYTRALKIPKELINNGWLEVADKNFTSNKKFYQPTGKALDLFCRLHLSENSTTMLNNEKPLLEKTESAFGNNEKPYKDKHKDKNNHNLNSLYQALETDGLSKTPDCDLTVIFAFDDFGLGKVECESGLFDYFTVSQAKVINTITNVFADKIDIIAFNNALARNDLKLEAKDFKQFIGWCYRLAVDAKCQSLLTVSDCDYFDSNCSVVDVSANHSQSEVSAVIDNTPSSDCTLAVDNIINSSSEIQSNIGNDVDLKRVSLRLQNLLVDYSLEQINIEINKIVTRFQTENELVNGVLFELGQISEDEFLSGCGNGFVGASETMFEKGGSLDTKQHHNNEHSNIVKSNTANKSNGNQADHKQNEIEFLNKDVDSGSKEVRENVIYDNHYQQPRLATNKTTLPELTCTDIHSMVIERTGKTDRKSVTENHFDDEAEPVEFFDIDLEDYHVRLLVNGVLAHGVQDKQKIITTARDVLESYGKLTIAELIHGVIYLLVDLPKKKVQTTPAFNEEDYFADSNLQSDPNNIHAEPSVNDETANDAEKEKVKPIQYIASNKNITTPMVNDLAMPVVDKVALKKDWISLADQNFNESVLPDCQKIALVAIIDYVKRHNVVITSDQEMYQWLYCAVVNHNYYFSRATSFKHLANILIKQLMARGFNRPSGFDNWLRLVNQGKASSVKNSIFC